MAILHFLRRMASTVETREVDEQSLNQELQLMGRSSLPPSVLVYEIDGPMFFGAVDNFERALQQTRTDPKTLIIRLRRVPFADITGIETLELAVQQLQKRGVTVMLCEATPNVLEKMKKAGLIGGKQGVLHCSKFSECMGLSEKL